MQGTFWTVASKNGECGLMGVNWSGCTSSCRFSLWSLEPAVHQSPRPSLPVGVSPSWPRGLSSSDLWLYSTPTGCSDSKGCWSRDCLQTAWASVTAKGRAATHCGAERNSGVSINNLDFRLSLRFPSQYPANDV